MSLIPGWAEDFANALKIVDANWWKQLPKLIEIAKEENNSRYTVAILTAMYIFEMHGVPISSPPEEMLESSIAGYVLSDNYIATQVVKSPKRFIQGLIALYDLQVVPDGQRRNLEYFDLVVHEVSEFYPGEISDKYSAHDYLATSKVSKVELGFDLWPDLDAFTWYVPPSNEFDF